MYQKIMFDRYHCIKTSCQSKTLENGSKSVFPVPIMARKGTYRVNVLNTPLPGQNITSCWRREITFATVHVTDDDVSFCDGPGMPIHKTEKPCINSTWTALLIHGFVPVKTWLSIAFDTAFYAIIEDIAVIMLKCRFFLSLNILDCSDVIRFYVDMFLPLQLEQAAL